MGFVDNEGLVLGEHGPAAPEVGPEQVKVDDDDVGDRGLGTGALGEAIGAGGTAMRPRALVDTHADG
jgi:hypothetical protein